MRSVFIGEHPPSEADVAASQDAAGPLTGTLEGFRRRARAGYARSIASEHDLPIAGLAPMLEHGRLVSSSFDAVVRVWDLRKWMPTHVLPLASNDPCTRVDVYHDAIVVGGREGTVTWIDMDPRRAETVTA